MTGRSSKTKGHTAERELAKLLVSWGITETKRTPLSGSLADFPCDLLIDGWAPEVKRQEKTSIWGWWAQTMAAARGGRHPILFFRRSRSTWLAVVEAETWAREQAELRRLRRFAWHNAPALAAFEMEAA